MKIAVYYPSNEISQDEIKSLVETLGFLPEVEAVYSYGRRQIDPEAILIVLANATAAAGAIALKKLVEEGAKLVLDEFVEHFQRFYLQSRLQRMPLEIRMDFSDNTPQIQFIVDVNSPDHIKDGLSMMPKLYVVFMEKMLAGRPSGVDSIRVTQDKATGKFEAAIAYNTQRKPMAVYLFNQQTWKSVRG